MRIPNILLGAACAAALAGTLGLATALPAHAHDAKPVDAVSIDTLRRELASSNTRLGGGDDRPAAEITPDGGLVIEGRAVPVDARQRALLLRYRTHVSDLAVAGAELGLRGAELGLRGAELAASLTGRAIAAALSGNEADIEAMAEAEADRIKSEALALCGHVEALLATQTTLADALPAFAPYATMDTDDVSDCRDDLVAHTR